MKKGWIYIGLIMLLPAIIGMAVTGCGSSSPLVGKWQQSEYEGYIEFFSNGTFELGSGGATIAGTYEETGNNEVALIIGGQSSEQADESDKLILEYTISGNELILSDGITPITFIRVE